ncbi:HpcH/HpaI aldolase family protein [Verrucomicrobium spinosum]|uniref:HpcH/HpaI aldolase family protein n=1 Tax=Verrucomicrobium spinosum TaxID=2736 RepID=UPI0001746A5A|nr:aldolase/citrate lyase family protein [Verrucomicrobium spinosum]
MDISLPEHGLQLGTWLQTGSSVIAELADASGFDWLLIDLEHGSGTEAAVLPQLQAIRRAAGIVRVGAPHPDLIGRVLDWGAAGVMVPHVSTVEKAELCVRAMRYPPLGDRGLAYMSRSHGYGMNQQTEETAPLFFAQIETIEAVENARAIAALDGVDVLFVGPADLRRNIQAYPQRATRDYTACLQEVAAAAQAAGKSCGLLLGHSDDALEFQALGFTHLAIETDITLLREGYRRALQPLRVNGAGKARLNGSPGLPAVRARNGAEVKCP